jgi:hypothetical protein
MTNMGDCPYDDCDGFLMLAVPERTPAYARVECPTCRRPVWYRFSRIDPEAWTEADFLATHEVDAATKTVRPEVETMDGTREIRREVDAAMDAAAALPGATMDSVFVAGQRVLLDRIPAMIVREFIIKPLKAAIEADRQRGRSRAFGDGYIPALPRDDPNPRPGKNPPGMKITGPRGRR